MQRQAKYKRNGGKIWTLKRFIWSFSECLLLMFISTFCALSVSASHLNLSSLLVRLSRWPTSCRYVNLCLKAFSTAVTSSILQYNTSSLSQIKTILSLPLRRVEMGFLWLPFLLYFSFGISCKAIRGGKGQWLYLYETFLVNIELTAHFAVYWAFR